MKTIYTLFALFFILNSKIQAQVSVTSGGVPAVYATLKQAFDAINAGVQFGVVNITITASTVEIPSVLNASGVGPANYLSVTILPTAAFTISGNSNGPLITLNGAQNVIFDGRIGGIGVTRSLTITNTSNLNAATISTLHFTNGASNNTLRYLNILGSGKANTSSTILFSTTSAILGNSNNTISDNNIGQAGANIPFTAISSAGAPLSNDNNTVTNNQVHDFFNPAGVSSGVRCGTNSSGWTITGNSFYHTTPKVSTANIVHNIIYILSGIGYTVDNNFIGGSLPNAGGGAASFSGNFYNLIVPIILQNTDGTVNGNTIRNFNIASNPISNTSIFNGIQTFGNVNIGTTSGNTIGSLTGTGAITISILGNNPSAVLGIVAGGAIYATDISNNNIGSFTLNGFGTGTAGFTGISTDNPSFLIQNNTIGGTTAASIQTNTPSSLIAGISMFQNINVLTQTCATNTIRNLTNNGLAAAAITGILSQIIAENVTTANSIYGNTITTLTSSSANPTLGSVQGIVITQSAGFINSFSNGDIYNNQINNLVSASTGAATIVRGISHENGYPTYLNMNANNIHTFTSTAPNTTSGVTGVVQGIASIIPSLGTLVIGDNLIYDLQNSASASTSVLGIGCTHYSDVDAGILLRNKIYNLRNPNAAATGLVSAITANGSTGVGTFTFSNNMLSLSPANVQAYGIYNNSAATQINMFFNSIVIGGIASGANNSGAFFRDGVATGISAINNIFHNTRTGGTGNHFSVLNTNGTPATGWVSNYNDLYSSNPTTIAFWGGTAMDFATYRSTSSQDANSKSVGVNFMDATNADLHLTGGSVGDQNLAGQFIVTILDDYDGEARSTTPYMGADELILTPLPVIVEYFRGKTQNNVNVLNWKISCGSSSVTFDLQRSNNARNFYSIGNFTVTQERCNQPFDYTDNNPFSGINYYRLKMTESSGAVTYSSIVSVANRKNGFDLGIYPTIIKNKAVVTVTSAINTNIEILVTDLQGKNIRKQTAQVMAGTASLDMNFSTLATGIYNLSVYTKEGNSKTIRFVKQ